MEVLVPTGPNREEHGIFATQLAEEWNSAASAITAWHSAIITKGTALLAIVEGFDNPVVNHNPSTKRGKRTIVRITKNEFSVLQGTGNPPLVYGIDPKEVFKSSGELEAPVFFYFVKAKDTAEVQKIHGRDTVKGSTIKLTSAITPLPGFMEAFLNEENRQTAPELLLLVVDEILRRSIEREPPVIDSNL